SLARPWRVIQQARPDHAGPQASQADGRSQPALAVCTLRKPAPLAQNKQIRARPALGYKPKQGQRPNPLAHKLHSRAGPTTSRSAPGRTTSGAEEVDRAIFRA